MKSFTILQNCQQSATFPTFSGKCWKLLQLHVTGNGKCYIIYYKLHIYYMHNFVTPVSVFLLE